MNLIPYEHFTIHSPLPINEASARMAQRTMEKRNHTWRALTFGELTRSFKGHTDLEGFRVTPIIFYRNSFLPLIKGKYSTDDNGTAIEIIMRLNTPSIIFLCIWLTGVGGMCITIIVVSLIHIREIFRVHSFSSVILIPFIMLFGFSYVVHYAYNSESRKAKEELLQIFAGEIVQQ